MAHHFQRIEDFIQRRFEPYIVSKRVCDGAFLYEFAQPPGDYSDEATDSLALLRNIGPDYRVQAKVADVFEIDGVVRRGESCLIPAQIENQIEVLKPQMIQVAAIRWDRLTELVEAPLDPLMSVAPHWSHPDRRPLFDLVMDYFWGVGEALGRLSTDAVLLALAERLAAPTPTPDNETRVLDPRRLALATAYLGDDPGAGKSMAEAARLLDVAPAYFSRAFKGAVGVSPSAFLIRRRVLKACELLRVGDAPIAEIGAAVGYPSKSAFSSIFRRIVGVSPREYRRQSRL